MKQYLKLFVIIAVEPFAEAFALALRAKPAANRAT